MITWRIAERTYVSVGGVKGREFGLEAGVPQGGVLSPTLFNVFCRDAPLAGGDSLNIAYADDVTHCISVWGGNRAWGLRVVRDVVRSQTEFELLWKISTNARKFEAIHLSTRSCLPLVVDGAHIPWVHSHRMLGWSLGKSHPVSDVRARKGRAFNALAKLGRFSSLPWKVKRQLYCALVRPILEYPPVPQHLLAKSRMLHLQRVQNRAVRWMLNRSLADCFRTEVLHNMAGLGALNMRLHEGAKRVWTAVGRHFRDLTARMGGRLRGGRDRVVFARSMGARPPETAIYS